MNNIVIDTSNLVENCSKIVTENFKITHDNKVLIFFDSVCPLSFIIAKGYLKACEALRINCEIINFYEFGGLDDPDSLDEEALSNFDDEKVKSKVEELAAGDLVVLSQSSSFRMSKYRWRNLLHDLDLKVAEHAHMRMNKDSEYNTYIQSLNYDLPHYKKTAAFLTEKINKCSSIKLISKSGKILVYSGKMDRVYENAANFEDKKDWGSRFPVGEIFTESLDLSTVNGEFEIYAFPKLDHKTQLCEKFLCKVEGGFIVSHDGPEEFDDLFKLLQAENPEGVCFIRELGMGMNRGIKRENRLGDISSYERHQGVHFSLGMKHGIYRKKLLAQYGKKFYQRYHIDVFVDADQILIDGVKVFQYGEGYLTE
jgi:aminopeptidase